ncbi:MAG: tetratricopeptide (TPR) repeat protein [Maribacter sp.]|jgi:tetratricopeptide (TPR) repeat protein
MNKWIIIAIVLVSHFNSFAQETTFYQDMLHPYNEGKVFFEEGLYFQSKESLETFLDDSKGTTQLINEVRRAELMIAKSAVFTKLNDGEKLMQEFIRKYAPEKIAQEAMMELADYYFNNKMYQQAIAYYEMAGTDNLDPATMSEVKYKQGYAYFVRDDKTNAKIQFEKIKGFQGKYHGEANYYLGIIAFEDNDYDDALEAFRDSNNKGKYDKIMPYYQCQIHFANEEYRDVITIGTAALESKKKIDYENSVTHLVAKSYFEQENYRMALPYFEEYSDNAKELRAQDLYQVAFTRYKNDKLEAAIKDFEELKSTDNELAQNALYYLGDSYLTKKDYYSARNAFYAASKMNYDAEIKQNSHFLYGKLSYQLGFDREAIAAFQTISTSSKNYDESQQMLGRIFMNTADYDKAIQLMQNIPNKTQKIKEAYQKVTYFKGVQLFNDKRYNDAKIYLRQSLQNTPNVMTKAQALFRLGEIAHKEKSYSASISELSKFIDIAKGYSSLPEETSINLAYYMQGYNYLKKKDYKNSGTYFESAINGFLDTWDTSYSNDVKTKVFPDALLRAADSYFMLKQYQNALSYYQTSINYKYNGYDYALFQKATIEKLNDNSIDQITNLKALVNQMPNSVYADDALLSLGNTYFRERNYGKAEEFTLKLVDGYAETSDLVNQGYLLLGLVNYNQNDKESSLKYYEKIFSNNPSQAEQSTALQSIEEIYIDNNNPLGFIDFQERVLGRKISDKDKEGIIFKAAELQYESSNFPAAIAAYTKYINRYPNGLYTLQAHYNRGESYLASEQLAASLPDYNFVISKGNSSLYEKALTKAAAISYNELEDFAKSYAYFSALAKVATDDNKKFDAHLGALRSAYKIGNKAGVYQEADAVIASNATDAQKSTANYYKAKIALTSKDYNTALVHFRNSANSNNLQGAESRYQIAYIYYVEQDLPVARDLCMAHLKKSKNYESWVARGLVLLSDIAFEQGDLFNARAALETLIENYKNPDDQGIIGTAKAKLATIAAKEGEGSRIIPE